jgi:hypothetical protein
MTTFYSPKNIIFLNKICNYYCEKSREVSFENYFIFIKMKLSNLSFLNQTLLVNF